MVLEFGDDRVPASEQERATLRKVVPGAWEAEDGDPPSEENIERVAGSFNEFLDDLEYEPFNSES